MRSSLSKSPIFASHTQTERRLCRQEAHKTPAEWEEITTVIFKKKKMICEHFFCAVCQCVCVASEAIREIDVCV